MIYLSLLEMYFLKVNVVRLLCSKVLIRVEMTENQLVVSRTDRKKENILKHSVFLSSVCATMYNTQNFWCRAMVNFSQSLSHVQVLLSAKFIRDAQC